jgi:hypothetical protein
MELLRICKNNQQKTEKKNARIALNVFHTAKPSVSLV